MRLLLPLLLCLGCSAGPPGTLPTPATALRPEDRVVIADFSRVTAVAAGREVAYVAYPTAIGVWHPFAKRWDVPRTPPRAGMLRDVRAGIVDPSDQSLWLITATGWIHYTPRLERWDEGLLPGTPSGIGVDPSDPRGGIWVRLNGTWYLQPRFGGAMPGTPSQSLRMAPTIEDAERDMPPLRALGPRLLTGEGLQQGRFTGAAPLPDNSGWLLGTTNRGVLFVDRMGVNGTPLPLGLRGTMVGAIIALRGGVWVATDADRWPSAELAHLTPDLATTTPVEGRQPFGLPFAAARQILLGNRVIWLATDQGVVRVGIDDHQTQRWSEGEGLPDQRVLALRHFQGRIIAATMRGLVEIAPNDVVGRIATRFLEPAYALEARGDTLWVATARGLRAWLPGDEGLAEPEGLARLTGSRVPVRGVGYVADTLVAVTEQQLLWRDPVSGAWTAGPPLLGIGRLNTVTITADGIWLGGDGGAGFARPTTGLLRRLSVPIDLPGPVTAIATEGAYLWIGTTEGLVRYRLEGR